MSDKLTEVETSRSDLELLSRALYDVERAIDQFEKKRWTCSPNEHLEKFEHELWRLEGLGTNNRTLADRIHKYLTDRKANHGYRPTD